jgi:radical SAM superfamily enzyme YgiQ (UPF0313 family)
MIRKAGINSMGHFMFGLPGDSKETTRKSIRYACKNVDFAQFYCAIPYPKTGLWKMAGEQNWIADYDYTRFELTRSVMRNEALTPEEIKRIRDSAYRKFYFRPKMLIQALREVRSVRSFFSILNFIMWIKPKNG